MVVGEVMIVGLSISIVMVSQFLRKPLYVKDISEVVGRARVCAVMLHGTALNIIRNELGTV